MQKSAKKDLRSFGLSALSYCRADGSPAPAKPWARPVCFVIDRVDSIVGGLSALAFVVPTPILTWCYILLVGPAFHWAFSLFLFQLGVKARPA